MAPKSDDAKEGNEPNELTEEKDDQKEKSKAAKKQKSGSSDDLMLKPDSLSEEDRELKERLETCVETLANVSQDPAVTTPLRLTALQMMVQELRTATSSMTSVPKPLKFLRPHYPLLKVTYEKLKKSAPATITGPLLELRARLADVLSVLAMTLSSSPSATMQPRESLKFKLAANDDNLGSWGHEFVRSLAGEIGEEYNARVVEDGVDPESGDEPFQDLLDLVKQIVPFHVTHNAEAEAVDLLIEVQRLQYLLQMQEQLIDETNAQRICLYLVKTADYMSDPDDFVEMLETAYEIYRKQGQYFDALRVGLRMGGERQEQIIPELLKECTDKLMRRQMCLLLGRHGVHFEVPDDFLEGMDGEVELLNELIGNEKLHEQFHKLAQDLDVLDPKTPEDIYKSHLAETGGFSRTPASRRDVQIDSARANLASTFVNAFVNAGFGQDKLMTASSPSSESGSGGNSSGNDNEWLYKNKDHGMLSAAASLGSILLWNVEEGLTQIDKYLYSSEDYVKAGATLAVGILSCGIRNDADPALALLTEHVESGSESPHIIKCAACTGLGIAYAGSAREDVLEVLTPMVESSGSPTSTKMLEVSLAGLALGMIFVGKCDDAVGGTIIQRLMEATDEELDHSHTRYLCLGLALLFLGQMEKADAMVEALKTIEHKKISKYAVTMLETCAYAGSGNVLWVQKMLHECAEHLAEDAEHQMAAVLGIALITMGEDVGSEMALRSFDHLLHYCELPIKRAVPLALAILHISNPEFTIIDQLLRLSHDPDPELAQNAILSLGIASAGTNNSRVAGLLRQLSEFYAKDAGHVFCVRLAQGMLHMGKGLLTLSPFHSDRMLLKGPALGGMLVLLHSCLDLKKTLLDKSHFLLYYLTCAMHPRMLITVSYNDAPVPGGAGGETVEPEVEDVVMEWRPVTVRVGQALETVGQAGKPRRITGFQTHTSPVLLATTDRAELGTEEVVAASGSTSPVLEGIVIVKDNPDYVKSGDDNDNKDKK
ncbi:hypothetical protein ACA910_002909 [Epithemia clementina (nom. ined.)]